MKYLFQNLKGYEKESILAPAFKMLEALFDLFVPLVVASIINDGIRNQDKTIIVTRCLLLVLLALIGLACSFTAQYFAAKAATACAAGMRGMLFRKIASLSFSEQDVAGTSTLITRMTSDINQVQNGVNMSLRLFMRSPFIVFGSLIMAFLIDPKVAVIFAIAIPILAVIVFGIMKVTAPLYKKLQGQLDRVTLSTRENLTGVRIVRAFGREEDEAAQFEAVNQELNRQQQFVGRISGLMNPFNLVVVNLAVILILYIGSMEVNNGVLLDGNVVALVNYMNQILVELIKLANTIVLLSKTIASVGRIETILDQEPKMLYPESTKADPVNDFEVCFDHVNMLYNGAGEESLTDISFSVKKGETIGVIGGTGSGKSTLVNLIPRFYDALSGTVSVAGIPVKEWKKEELNAHVGIVMQKAQLFAGTIRSNLLMADPKASEEELWEALEMAQAAEFVKEKQQGLDDPVEQGGRNLSGGQKQRLTIARALVKKPEILILDDSASALDFATDAALRKALNRMHGERTIFIVSQRTSSLKHADRILVLEDGRLLATGTHADLLENCEVYREIHESQFKEGGK